MCDEANLLERFMRAQRCEERADEAGAAEHYGEVITAAEYLASPLPSPLTDTALREAVAPPVSLVASMACTSLGGLHLDAQRLEQARGCFVSSLGWWPDNAMSLLNLGDLEREHGSLSLAVTHYVSAAALPPVHEAGGELSGEEEDDAGEEMPTWFDQWVSMPRVEAVALASYMCALLHHQSLAFDRALPYLRRFSRLRYRLAPALWRLACTRPLANASLPSSAAAIRKDPQAVRRFDQSVPIPLLERLRSAFAVSSPFWTESRYAGRGYFSFWYDVSQPPRSCVEALAKHLLPLTGCAEQIVGCEWWVHTRAQGRSIGHQMHFDTEESTLARGDVLHPIVSSVTYIDGDPTQSDPTVVLDQRVTDDFAPSAWVSHPTLGSTLFFPGDRLHCVVPAAPAAPAAPPPLHNGRKRVRPSASVNGDERLTPSMEQPQRVTLMIGFWAQPVHTECRRVPYDACGPVPRGTRACTWPEKLTLPTEPSEVAELQQGCERALTQVTCRNVPSFKGDPWERIKGAKEGSAASSGPDGTAGHWLDLDVPEARNHRFFVSSIKEFREQIFNPSIDDAIDG